MHRLSLFLPLLLSGFVAACGDTPSDFEEASITDLHDRMQRGELRAEQLVDWYLQRIEAIDHAGAGLNSIIEVNPDAIAIARSLDEVLYYEFKADLIRYLEQSGVPLESLAAVIRFNEENAATVMPFFGQEHMLAAEAKGPLSEAEYEQALAASGAAMREKLTAVLDEHDLDALVAPTNGPAWMTDHVNGDNYVIGSSSFAAVAGFPNVTVPAGFVAGLPVGLSFIGRAFAEKDLIEMAYAFEQATLARRAP